MKPMRAFSAMLDHRLGDMLAHDFELVRQAIHVVDVIVFALGVLGLFVVAAAAGEVGRGGMVGAGQGAVADAVAIHVAVTGEAAEPFEIFGGQHLAAADGLFGIGEGVGHPVVHAQIEIGHDEDRGLELLGEFEGFDGHGEALFGRAREEHGVLGIAVGEERGGEEVALRGAGGQAGGGADALDVEDARRGFRRSSRGR